MVNKTEEEIIRECDKQVDNLYIHFGKFLYENIEKENIYYCFESKDNNLEEQANGLLQKLKYNEETEPEEKIEPGTEVNQEQEIGPVEKGNAIESYTRLMVSLYEIKRRLLILQEDVEECLPFAISDTHRTNTEDLVNKLKENEKTIISLIENNTEVIRGIMEKKRQLIEDSNTAIEVPMSKIEDEFLKKAAADIESTTRQVDTLVKEAIVLFQEIKHSYEKDFKADNSGAGETEQELPVEEAQGNEQEKEQLTQQSEEKQEDAKEQEQGTGEPDNDLFETVSKKIRDENVTRQEKTEILNLLFRSAPNKGAGFLSDMIRDSDLSLRKQLIDLLKGLDNSVLIGLYRRFINDEQAFLRLHAIMGLQRLGSQQAKELIFSVVDDPEPHVRRLVANCLDSLGSDSEMAAIIKLSNDNDETVARIAIRKLKRVKSRFSFINLIPKLESPNIKIRKEAIEVLKSITGTDLCYRYSAPEPDRKAAVRNWQKWWRENRTNPDFLQEIKANHLLVRTKPDKQIKRASRGKSELRRSTKKNI